MTSREFVERTVDLTVRNIGGIDETVVEISDGVTVLAGRNATNRTSLLQAIAGAIGSEHVSLKGNADEGSVELTLDGETYTREFVKRNGTVVSRGESSFGDSELVDLFAVLLESNEARRAVRRDADLRELIMRPVDTAAIEREIEECRTERDQVEERLDEIESMAERLPSLEQRRQELTDKIEEKRKTLRETERQIEDTDTDIDATREDKERLEEKLETLRQTRTELENTRYDIENEQESIDALEDEREEIRRELSSLPDHPGDEIGDIDATIGQLRERKRSLDGTVSELQTVVQFNEEMLHETDGPILDSFEDDHSEEYETDGDALTDSLVEDDEVVCWTCGSDVDRDRIDETLCRLRSLLEDKRTERSSVQSDIDDLRAEKSTYEDQKQRREKLNRRLDTTEDELETRRSRLETLRDSREERERRIADLEDEVETLQSETHSQLLDLHREANQLEFDLGKLESQRADAEAEIETIEDALDRKDDLVDRREELAAELADLRTRIDQIERDAVDAFNDHMDTMLDVLQYDNLERVWIERKEQSVRDGRRTVEQSVFDLHIVRTDGDGTAYEDTIDHLSESEREVVGIVFTLAGYLTHDVHEEVPVLLLDSLEAIDSDRIAALVDYVSEYPEYTVVALLPEDDQAVDDDYQRISNI